MKKNCQALLGGLAAWIRANLNNKNRKEWESKKIKNRKIQFSNSRNECGQQKGYSDNANFVNS